MLYHARSLARPVRYPWEKKKIQVFATIESPSQVQRDYSRIIRRIGTPAPIPKPRGKSPGRRLGQKGKERPDHPLVRKSVKKEIGSENLAPSKQGKKPRRKPTPQVRYRRMQRIWSKSRPAPMRC